MSIDKAIQYYLDGYPRQAINKARIHGWLNPGHDMYSGGYGSSVAHMIRIWPERIDRAIPELRRKIAMIRMQPGTNRPRTINISEAVDVHRLEGQLARALWLRDHRSSDVIDSSEFSYCPFTLDGVIVEIT